MVNEPDEDGNAIGDVKSDCSNGGGSGEGDGGAEGWEGEAEGEGCCEPDGADGGAEAVVDLVEE